MFCYLREAERDSCVTKYWISSENPIRLKITNYGKYQRITWDFAQTCETSTFNAIFSLTHKFFTTASINKKARDKRKKKEIRPTLPPPFYDSACGLRASLRDDMNASRTANQ